MKAQKNPLLVAMLLIETPRSQYLHNISVDGLGEVVVEVEKGREGSSSMILWGNSFLLLLVGTIDGDTRDWVLHSSLEEVGQ